MAYGTGSTGGIFVSPGPAPCIPAMSALEYWTKALRDAEQALDSATTRTG